MPNPSRHLRINFKLIRERDRKATRDLIFLFLISSALLLPLLLYVRQRMEFVQLGYRLEALTQERDRLEDLNRRLRLERASLRSLGRVERIARRDLGLVDQRSSEIVGPGGDPSPRPVERP